MGQEVKTLVSDVKGRLFESVAIQFPLLVELAKLVYKREKKNAHTH